MELGCERFGFRMKILVVEDDPQTAAYVAKGLRQAAHVVDVAVNGRDGFSMATVDAYDVLIVDRRLPGLDGLKLVKSLRNFGVRTLTMFLTTMDGIDDRVQGLEAGGDDYLVKPFAFAELQARVGALSRRRPAAPEETALRVGDLELNLLQRRAIRNGRPIDLLPQEFKLLEFLMRNAGRIATRTMLLEGVWGFHFDPRTSIVETHISRLRGKLSGPQERDLIRTVRGAGYMIVASDEDV
jgi:two-component system OmpR family response regulator